MNRALAIFTFAFCLLHFCMAGPTNTAVFIGNSQLTTNNAGSSNAFLSDITNAIGGAGTNPAVFWLGQWQIWTNPADNSLTFSNTVTRSNAITLLTNGSALIYGSLTNNGVFWSPAAVLRSPTTTALLDGAGSEILLNAAGNILISPGAGSILAGNISSGTLSASGITGTSLTVNGATTLNGPSTITNTLSISSPLWITNSTLTGIIITNPASKTFEIIGTNGLFSMNAGIFAGGIYHTNGITMTNNAGESLNMFWDGTSFWREVPQDWGTGSGLLFESGSAGGFALVSGDGLANVQIQGNAAANVVLQGTTITVQGELIGNGTSALDSGAITTDGSGDLTIVKLASSDGGNFSSDGSGNVTAVSFTGSGANLTSLNANNLSSGTLPQARLPGFVITNANATRFTNAAAFTNTSTADITGTLTAFGNASVKGILSPSIISNNVSGVTGVSIVTNGTMCWISFPTNNTMKFFTNVGMGSICTTTNGQFFVLSNLFWVPAHLD